jgi:hypothetical protein
MTSFKEGPVDLLEGRTPVELRSKGYGRAYFMYVSTEAHKNRARWPPEAVYE